MLTLLGSLLGFLGSAFPQILKLFQDVLFTICQWHVVNRTSMKP